ncbi:chorismate mutase [Silvimonas iriomotensis]|uniref:chorismate mutase n=1 Tax=Silvimonas iriomotensis TaxID=449662 RepID=A0ABQ2PAJ9_9NEIS|nr:chorismate mutase [Silvimonas iriomotensis]GGP22046.1 chorismate mutase [Silvimonas iriomotensis]
MSENNPLAEVRKSIDNLDNAIVAILAERFRLTERVGVIKQSESLPVEDLDRERLQEAHYRELAVSYGLNQDTLVEIMKTIIGQVKKRHADIIAEHTK